MPTPLEIATFRFEQIAPLFDHSLSAAEKRRVRRERCCQKVLWPNGRMKPIPRATLSRWVTLFTKQGFLGLMPKRRRDRGKKRRDSQEIVEHAILLLLERPERSIYLVSQFLARTFPGYDLPRATLARHVRAHPLHALIEKLRGKSEKLRGRYEAKAPHECWQLDGKGRFRVRLMNGRTVQALLLTVLDDYSRAALAGFVATGEDEVAAVQVFQKAVLRFGLPERMQFDRGSAFDSHVFRHGLAQLGVHRNAVKARNPRAQGKIEAVNKGIGLWFVDELKVQQVRDLEHLQQLYDAFLELVYQKHYHRTIRTTPAQRLGCSVSLRRISESDLERAFFVTQNAKSDRTTGEVSLQNGRFVVPKAYAGKRARFRCDPVRPRAFIVTGDDREIELQRFAIKPLPKPVLPDRSRPAGQLQVLLEEYQGRTRENAEPAFGLPEVFVALSRLAERRVPSGEAEAQLVLGFWGRFGPIAKEPFLKVCAELGRALGTRRPLAVYLDHLTRRIESDRRALASAKESP